MSSEIGSVDAATDIMGDKWTPRLLRFFLTEPTVRFCQLQDMTGDINPRTLSSRLVKLEQEGIIVKRPTSPSRCEYELTAKGRDLLPILKQMHSWSDKYA
ncbi:helix-turn-helix transcriptional regulator [Candidatus Saccharibacteria bacterium]|nr:helix-turn-helix transcriptional regulator [Candidatus Saccharibacteria bacterium]